MKNINFNVKLSDIRITDEFKKRIFGILERNLRLIMLIFVGVTTIYSFNIIFKKAYVEIVYIQYPGYTNTIIEGREKTMLEDIIQVINNRKKNLAELGDKHYTDPFSFRENISSQPIVVVEDESEDEPEAMIEKDSEDGSEVAIEADDIPVDRGGKSVLAEEGE